MVGGFFPISPINRLEGMDACDKLHSHGIPITLGKFSKEGDDPEQSAQEYMLSSDAFKCGPHDDSFYLSVKPPALLFDFNHAAAIAVKAFENGQGISFDSHKHNQQSQTIQLLQELMDSIGAENRIVGRWRYGLTLASRWKRSLDDAQWVAKQGVRPRIVKGEFKATYMSDEMHPAKGFLELVSSLAGKVPEIVVATHDYGLAKEAINLAKTKGCSVQLELLFGMPASNMIDLAQRMGVSVRFYVPYSDALLIYGVRQFLTNPHKLLRPHLTELFASHNMKMLRTIGSLSTARENSL